MTEPWHLPPGPYDLAECDDGPDPVLVMKFKTLCHEELRVNGADDIVDRLGPFDTQEEAEATGAAWLLENPSDDEWVYTITVEEIEVETYSEPDDNPNEGIAREPWDYD